MNKIIEVKNLKKSYSKLKAVNGISFYAEEGKMLAFLGPNGAGKSTTINMICTFLKPDSGKVLVNGYELGRQDQQIRDSIGIVFQQGLLDKTLTIEENLYIRGSFYNIKRNDLKNRIKDISEKIGIEEILKRPYGKLSGGQRRRADIARAILNKPKILFLDEPTTALDPQTRQSVWNTIKKLQKENGTTVFLTTHYMEEAEEADFCVIVDKGRVVSEGTPLELKNKYVKDRLLIVPENNTNLIDDIKNDGIIAKRDKGIIKIELKSTKDSISILNKYKDAVKDFSVIKGSMDDVFLQITGREIRE